MAGEGQAKPVLSGVESHTARQGKGIEAKPALREGESHAARQRHCSACQA